MTVTESSDRDLYLALGWRRSLLPTLPGESDERTITRLAVDFLGLDPRASARDALLALARADWDLDAALERWSLETSNGGNDEARRNNSEDEGQPPRKRQRRDDDDDEDEAEGGDDGGKRKGKGKGKSQGQGKGKGKSKERA